MHGKLLIELPNGISLCECCSRFCAWDGFSQKANEPFSCPKCQRLLADGDEFLARHTLEEEVIDLVPESVARDTNSIGYCMTTYGLICFADVTQPEVLDNNEKTRFHLSRTVYNVHADANEIRSAIDRHYGPDHGF